MSRNTLVLQLTPIETEGVNVSPSFGFLQVQDQATQIAAFERSGLQLEGQVAAAQQQSQATASQVRQWPSKEYKREGEG